MGGELRDKVASGVAWSLGEKLGTILLQMVVSIVVARLLMPDDVGLMALMTFFSSLALVVVDSGFSQMLIRKGDPAQGDYKSVFLFNVVVSWIVYGVLVAVFPAVAAFYGRPIRRVSRRCSFFWCRSMRWVRSRIRSSCGSSASRCCRRSLSSRRLRAVCWP